MIPRSFLHFVYTLAYINFVSSWMVSQGSFGSAKQGRRRIAFKGDGRRVASWLPSTAFEAEFYDAYDDSSEPTSPLQVPPSTPIVIGLNKYTHDTALCAAHADRGEVLFAISKERLTRKKHDTGNVAGLIETCLETLDLQMEDIKKVVMNNHHHRILPLEASLRHLEWESGLRINGGVEGGYEDPENLLPDVEKHELSHHLAHAYSTATQAPFDRGMCVVMDGMGETFRTMLEAESNNDRNYTSDISFGLDTFRCVPADIAEQAATQPFDFREAESVYVFKKRGGVIELFPVFKRFTPERSAPTLYNHGFENMESVGAVYSRASSHIFGDWNACGKVMGLAPWSHHEWRRDNETIVPTLHDAPIMNGSLYREDDNAFQINRTLLEGIPISARKDPDMFLPDGQMKKIFDFDESRSNSSESSTNETVRIPTQAALDAIAVAHRVQSDLESTCIDFVQHFKNETGEENLCVAGGVALNSVLNGRLARELGFTSTFISPYPGDEGVAVGCCAFGLYGNTRLKNTGNIASRLWKNPISPYLGPQYWYEQVRDAVDWASPWLQIDTIRDEDRLLEAMATEISSGGVVAWYRSRSEMGPRALGHRSILADPRKKGLVRFINEHVKSRESFRPFAPSVLSNKANEWFDLGNSTNSESNVSPYMSMTAFVKKEKRALIPAVTHVDGSSRLQTVTSKAEPLYHMLISKFYAMTGIPMVLNTSFNTLPGEPIVESPRDAVRSFLYSMGAIEMLVIDNYVLTRRPADLKRLLGEVSKSGEVKVEPIQPQRAGYAKLQSSFDMAAGESDEEDIETKTKVWMPDRPMHGPSNEWFELLDDLEGEVLAVCDGSATLNDIMAFYTTVDENQEIGEDEVLDAELLLQNVVQRLVRLYEHTLVSW